MSAINTVGQTVGEIGLGSTLAGGVFSAFGARKQAAASSKMYGYEASVANYQAQVAQQNAEYARQQGELQAQQFGLQAGAQKGHIIASQASSGLDVRSGSAKQVQESQQRLTDIDLDQIRSNAAKTAYNFDVQGSLDTAQAGLYQMAGQNAAQAGLINEFGTVLGTAGSVSAKWLQGQQMGLWS